jgi:hypothetical protein
MLKWKDYGEACSYAAFGILQISCVGSIRGPFKDGSRQYMIYLSVPVADSKEIITLTKVRGHLADAKAEAERLFKNLKCVTNELQRR